MKWCLAMSLAHTELFLKYSPIASDAARFCSGETSLSFSIPASLSASSKFAFAPDGRFLSIE